MDSRVPVFDLQAFATDDDLAEAVAQEFADTISTARTRSRFFTVALSGGRIASRFFTAAVKPVASGGGVGGLTHFFWADERCVAPDHAESNYRAADELLLKPLGIAPAQVHRILGELIPAEAAQSATAEFAGLMAGYGVVPPQLDLALLGMGEDGHIASLFPQEPIYSTQDESVFRAVVSPKPPPNRVTMGYSTLVAAREVWALVSGTGKEKALRESLSPDGKTPLARLLRMRTNTRVFSSVPHSVSSLSKL